ncbi:MAG TPA: DUF4241 domain-containing protein, partial [Candidatus Limnocylindrales bacterium]|nr:DUF4241 domain-containing protein [Candidatus Limnocylindrales bacterium]
MDARRSVLLAVAIVTVVATAIVAVSPRPPRRQVAEHVPPAPPRMTPADVFTMFARPSAARSFDIPVRLAVEDVGVLVLPSGGLVASDAFIIDGTPFTLDVPAGRYPVSVLRSDFQDGDRRIAAALVRVADGDPVRWELALVPGQDPTSLAPDEVFGYGVDSGTGAFTSPEAVAWLKDESRYTAYSDELLAAIPGTTLNDPLAA